MTVQTNTNVASFNGDGANKVFPIGYKFNSAADLVITLIDDEAKTTQILTLNSDFTVTGAVDEEGGVVTLVVAPTAVQRLKVTRVVDILQLTDLRNQGKFYAEIHEDVFDLLIMIDQQQQTEIDDANTKSDEAVATANEANAKSDQAVAKADQNLVDMQAQYDAFEQGAALYVIGDYAAGLVISAYNQIFRKDGEFYRAAAILDLSYTLTGNWATESVNFVSVGDDVLRQDLSIISVREYTGAPDGVTNNQAGIEAAVQAAKLAGGELWWPAGTYVSNSSIPDFWLVKHTGPGVLDVGTGTYYFTQVSQTNNLYLSTTGSDSNDGLSVSRPRATLDGLNSLLVSVGPVLPGTWKINLAAGTYSQVDYTFPPGLRSLNPVYFSGPLSVHPATPTAVIDGGGAGVFGMQLKRDCAVYLTDLVIQNFTTYGVVGQDFSTLYGLRTHVKGVPKGPAVKLQQGRLYYTDGQVSGSQIGFSLISGTTFTITGSSGVPGEGCIIKDNTQSGVQAQEQSSGHIDYCMVQNNPVGLQCVQRSRVHAMSTTITGSVTAGVRCFGASDWLNNGCTLTSNDTNELFYTGSIEADQYINNKALSLRPIDATYVTHTGTALATTLKTYSDVIPADNFSNSTKSLRVKLIGDLVGTADSKNIVVNAGGSALFGFTLPASYSGSFVICGDIICLTGTSQTYSATAIVSASSPLVATGSRSVNMLTGAAVPVTVVVTLASVADTLNLRYVEVSVT